jgi:hypothetical protein
MDSDFQREIHNQLELLAVIIGGNIYYQRACKFIMDKKDETGTFFSSFTELGISNSRILLEKAYVDFTAIPGSSSVVMAVGTVTVFNMLERILLDWSVLSGLESYDYDNFLKYFYLANGRVIFPQETDISDWDVTLTDIKSNPFTFAILLVEALRSVQPNYSRPFGQNGTSELVRQMNTQPIFQQHFPDVSWPAIKTDVTPAPAPRKKSKL